MRTTFSVPKWILHVAAIFAFIAYVCLMNVRIQIDGINNITILVLLLGYVAWAFSRCYINRNMFGSMAIAIFLIAMFYQLFTKPLNTPYPFFSYIILLSCDYFTVAVYHTLMKRQKRKEMQIVFVGITIFLVYVYINTIMEYAINENAVHALTKMNYLNATDDISNIATIDTSYAIIPLICLVSYYIKNIQYRFFKTLLIIIAAMLIYVAMIAQYTSVILILLIVLAFETIKTSNKNYSKIIWFMLIGVLVCFLPMILEFMAETVDSANMRVRMIEVANALRYGDLSGYNLSSRLNLYMEGIEAFLKSPIWGNERLNFNPHSSFIQIAADLGVFGFIPYIFLLNQANKSIKSTLHGKSRVIFKAALLSLIITGIINPIISMYAMYMIIFLYIPLGLQIFYGGKTANEYSCDGKAPMEN